MEGQSKATRVINASIFLTVSIPIQLIFWTVYHTTRSSSSLNAEALVALAAMSGGYLLLALGLAKRKNWVRMTTLVIVSGMAATSIIKLFKGLSHPSAGYLLFLITYLLIIGFLLSPPVKRDFNRQP